jgi:LPXTG-motif cell wall-anchored protein
VTVTTVTKKGEDKVVNKTVTKTVQTPTKNVVRSPKTGDTTQILAISAVALASGVILLILAVVLIKKRKEEKGEGQR